jgi:hypothetical protein
VGAKWTAAVTAVVVGCTPGAVPVVDAGSGSPPELASSLNVRVAEDTVVLEIHITNVATTPIVLEFMTTQRYDFDITSPGGERIWRWSAARSFGEALGREELQPGESRRYAATWRGNGREGDFVATGWIVSGNYPVELRTGFRLPAE